VKFKRDIQEIERVEPVPLVHEEHNESLEMGVYWEKLLEGRGGVREDQKKMKRNTPSLYQLNYFSL